MRPPPRPQRWLANSPADSHSSSSPCPAATALALSPRSRAARWRSRACQAAARHPSHDPTALQKKQQSHRQTAPQKNDQTAPQRKEHHPSHNRTACLHLLQSSIPSCQPALLPLPAGILLPLPPSWRWMGSFRFLLAFRFHWHSASPAPELALDGRLPLPAGIPLPPPPSWRWMGGFRFLLA